MKTVRSRAICATLLSFLSLQPLTALASGDITLINHYSQPLKFFVGNQEVVPGFANQFMLPVNTTVKSHVKMTDKYSHSFIRGEDETNEKKFAFFAVEDVTNGIFIHGYMSEGIAYSWNTNTVIFCTPEEYKKRNSCFS